MKLKHIIIIEVGEGSAEDHAFLKQMFIKLIKSFSDNSNDNLGIRIKSIMKSEVEKGE